MAKKTFVNPFATVGFNQGNYTPYEQQNLLDAEENDRLYQEYLNSGMAQQGFQPQDNSSAIGRGLTAGAAGVIEGQAQLANLLGVGDGQMVQYLQKINRNNARKKEYSIADMIPFASDYWTNTEGAAYDVANMIGSSGAMMAETAALMTGAGAIGGALGLGGGAAAAGGGFAGALSRGAGLAPNAVKKLAGKMAAAANNRGYTKLGKALEGPMGQMYALNILKTPIEVSSEAGSAGADALAEGADVWEARKRAGITALVQAPLLAMSNTIESANLGGLFSKEIGKKATKEAIISLLGDITKDGLQNAWEEGMQQSSQEYAAGKQSLLGVVNPFQWSPEALQEAAVGAVGGMALGGGNAMLGTVAGGRETQQAPNQERPTQEPTPVASAPTPTAAGQPKVDTSRITPADAKVFLEGYRDSESTGAEYAEIDEILDSGDEAAIVKKAAELGFGQNTQATPAAQEPPKPVETPAPATPPTPAEPTVETPPAPATPEVTPWNGEKVKIGKAELSPIVSDDGQIVIKGSKELTKNDKKAMRDNGVVWDTKKQAYILKDTPEVRKWLGGYAIAGTKAAEPIKEEAVKPKEKIGGFNFVEQDKETGLIWLASATNPNKLAILGKDKKGFKAVVFNKGEIFKDKFQKFKTLEEAEAYIANYKDEAPVEHIKEEAIKEEGVKEENVKEEAPAGEGTPDKDNADGNTGEPVKPIKPTTVKKKWKGGHILVGGVEMAPLHDKETDTINIELPAGRELSDAVRAELETAGMQETSKGSWKGLNTDKLQSFLETGELAFKEKEKDTASFMKKKFKKKVGKYKVDEQDDNTDSVHNYIHSDDDGENGSRWLTLEKKNGKLAVSMGYVGGPTEKTAEFATLDEAEQYVKDNELPPKAKEVKEDGGKENTDKDNGNEDKGGTPEPKPIKTAEADDNTGKGENSNAEGLEDNATPPKPATPPAVEVQADENGVRPLVKGMGAEEAKARIAENDKAAYAAAEKLKKQYDDGELTAEEARTAISELTSKYNKGKTKPVSKETLNKMAQLRKDITAAEKAKKEAPKLEAKKATEEAIAAGEQLVKEACDRIIADEKQPLDDDVWMEATKAINEKLGAAGLKLLSKTKKEDLERKYRMMLVDAKKEASNIQKQYYDIRDMFDAETKNIYNSVYDGKLDAQKGLEQYNKLKEKFEADVKEIGRKPDRYVIDTLYGTRGKFIEAMTNPKSKAYLFVKLDKSLEGIVKDFKQERLYAREMVSDQPTGATAKVIQEYQNKIEAAYKEYLSDISEAGKEPTSSAEKRYKESLDAIDRHIKALYPQEYLSHLTSVMAYDEDVDNAIRLYKDKKISASEALERVKKLNDEYKDVFTETKTFTSRSGLYLETEYGPESFAEQATRNLEKLQYLIAERGEATPSNPTSLEGNNFGEYTDSIMGAGTIEAIFGGTNVIKERVTETPNPKDQAIVDAMVEEKVADAADEKDPIEGDNVISKIDKIIAAKKDSRTTDYFRKHYDVKLKIKECLEKGISALYYTEYKAKNGKGSQTKYYYTLAGDDTLHDDMKGVAIRVMAELAGNADGPMKIVPINLKEYKQKINEKYLKELPSDEDSFEEFGDWLYGWYGDDEDLDIKATQTILEKEYTEENPCPLNSLYKEKHDTIINEIWGGDWTFKSLGDFVRKATIINTAYGELNDQYNIIIDEESLSDLQDDEREAVIRYADWWDEQVKSKPQDYPIRHRFTKEVTEETLISDEALSKKIKTEGEQHEEDFHEKTADEADADAEANLAKAEEFARNVATADALDKAKAKQKEKIAKAEKEGKRVSEVATVSEEDTARIKAAKAEALAALNVATDEINALYKADSNEQVPLENFKSSIIKQIVHAGYIVMKNAGQKLYKDWRRSMEELVDSMKGLKDQGKAYAKRVLDSAWDFITNLPERVSFAADKLKDTLDNIGMALDIALAGNDRGFGQKETETMLQANNQPLYNRVKDYLASAFKALVRYPRRGIDNHGGEDNVDVRTPEQYVEGDSGRRNGNGLEANTGNTGRGSQMGSGTATDRQTGSEVQVYGTAGDNTEKTSSPVPRGGTAAGGEQGNLQGGKEEPNDKTGLPRDTNKSGSDRTGNGRGSKLPTKRTKNNRNVSKDNAGPQGSDVAPKTISQLRQQFNNSPFKPADEKGIAEAVPNLLPEQIQDEVAIERRLWTNNGKGMLVANGTGTGKTVVGLAQVVRCIQKGAKKILIVVPNSTVKDRWVDDAKLVGLPKDVFATITSGEVVDDKINFVSYKSFSDNKNILDQSWDFVIMDEAHTVSGGQDNADYIGFRTQNAQTLRAITGHERTGFDDYMWSKYRDKYNRLYGKDGLVEAEAQAYKDLDASLNSPAAGQDLINENRAKHAQLKKELDALTIELEVLKDKERPKYEKRLLARKEDTRVLLLSATPFAYGNNIYYAEGLLFNYEKDYNDFMVNKLGYVLQDENSTVDIRRNMDKSPNPDHDAEVRFHDELIKSGAMINRRLEVPQDYNRRFIKVNGGIGQEIDAGFDYINEKYSASGLNKAFIDHFKYASLCRLLEAIKAEAAIPVIKEYVKQGKKVVLFHDYIKDVKIPHPFVLSNVAQSKLSDEARAAYKKFREDDEEGKRLQALPFNGAKLADKIIEEAFGSSAVIVNGDVAPSKRKARVDAFNNADSGVNIISVSTAAGKEGISLHDKIKDGEGNSLRSVPRVLINIGMPTRPTDAIQTEGRIYRLGQQSNAMFRYLYTDTHTERQAYTKYISTRTSTVEHLALGNQARNLEATFSYGYLESLGYDTNFNAAQDTMNTGGKALDNMSDEEVNATLKKIRKALSGKKGMTEETLAKLDKQIQDLDDRINEQKRSEILTPENEAKTVNAIKNAVNGGKVTKAKDGVYVVTLPNGMNLWFDLNESQVAILSRMSDEQKKRMMSAHDIRNSGYVIRGAYTQKYMPQYDGVMNLVKLTEAATQHTVDHEVYHFVQKMLLSPSELAKVMDYWKYMLKKDIGADAYNQLSEKEILDRCLEMDADMHANFMAYERKPKNFIERVAWKVTKWLANFANKFGIDTPAGMYLRTASGEMFRRRDNLTSEEIAQRIRDVGIKPTKMAKALYQTAWHGTGYLFDEFSTQKIGTGEGSQVHGWGLYFASNKDIANRYKEFVATKLLGGGDELSFPISIHIGTHKGRVEDIAGDTKIYLDGKPVKDWALVEAILTLADKDYSYGNKKGTGSIKAAIRDLRGRIYANNKLLREHAAELDVENKKDFQEAINNWARGIKALERLSNGKDVYKYEMEFPVSPESIRPTLYKVEVPENSVLLDENAGFKEQPDAVKNAVKSIVDKTFDSEIRELAAKYPELADAPSGEKPQYVELTEEEIQKELKWWKNTMGGEESDAAIRKLIIDFHKNDYEVALRQYEEAKNARSSVIATFKDKLEFASDNLEGIRSAINDFVDRLPYGTNRQRDAIKSRLLLSSLKKHGLLDKSTEFTGYDIYSNIMHGYADGNPKTASLLLNKHGVEGLRYIGQRDGECFVVFDDNAVAIKERYDLALQNNKDLIERSYKECEDEMRKAFPNGKFTPIDANRWLVELKGGARYEIDIKDRIIVNAAEEAKARKDHGLKGKAGEVAITGKYQGITEDIVDGVISLSRKSAQGTGYHEVYHAAWDAVLNEKEKAALIKEYEAQAKAEGRNVQEVIADAVMSNTLKRQANDSRILSRVKQRVLDFAYALKALFTRMENVHNVMRKIEQGEVWNRTPNELQQSSSRYQAAGVKAKAALGEEQPGGTMMFSITPMDEVDGKGMPDDLKNVVNAPDSVGASVDSKATKKDLDKLLIAKMMKEQGKTREEIFEKTGWWADKNGNWSLAKPKDSGEKEKPSKDAKKPYNWQKPNLDKATEDGDNSIEPAPEVAQEPKQYKNVDEVMEDAQKNADDAKTTGEIRVKDTSMTPREKNKTVGFFDSLIGSPSELAKKYPVFRSFYRIYQKAEEVQEKLRSRWRKQFQSDIAELKSNDDMDAYLDIMLDGELKQKEYTLAELKEQGIADNVARAYTRTRQLIRNIWESVNDAHRGVTVRIDKLNGKSIKELKEKPFEENIMVRESSDAAFVPLEKAELKDDVEYEVKHSRPHVYRSQQILTKEQLDTLRNSPYANVSNVEEHKVKGVDAVMYRANIERVAAPIGKITGYLPHIFEQWLVMVNTDAGPQIVGSGQSLDLALQEAKRLKEQTKGNVDFYIAPKIFDPSGVYDGDVADGKKGNPNITLSAQDFAKLEKSLRDTFNLSMAEAEEALGKVAKRESRSRFLGNLRHRKGRVGYNSDVVNTLDRYISMTSRYVALQPAKRRAVNLFERTFGPLDKDYSGKDSMAVTVRRYMRYCNGTPNFLESWITSQLNKMDWWKRKVSSQYGDRTLMALAGKANGLLSMSLLGCFNISSAVVGLTQLINTYGLIGGRYLGEGMAAVQRMNLRDKRILTEAGIPYNIGLDTPSGFTKRREGIDSATAFGNMRRMLSYAGNKGMYFFKQADRLTRNATTLGAYYKAIADGKTHKQAIEYAKDINRRSNFSYGAADAAGIFQWTAGTGFGELSLLFQKYPMKEWELMKSMMPIIGSSTKAEKARFWGAYFLMAGLAGIPAGEWLDWLIETLFGIKPSAAFKSVLFKEYGDTPFTRTVAYGIGANAGVDISRRVGMANMIPDSASMWGYLFGPAGNITERMIRSAASQDYVKAIKAVNPVMGNLAEAVIHGYSTNSKGQINYMYNDVEKVLKSMGFRTVGESMDSDLRTAVYLDKQSRKDDRQKVMMEMVKKRIDGEALTPEDYKALREQGITGTQFQKAVKAAKMTALQRTRAGMTKQQKKDFAGTLVMEEDE